MSPSTARPPTTRGRGLPQRAPCPPSDAHGSIAADTAGRSGQAHAAGRHRPAGLHGRRVHRHPAVLAASIRSGAMPSLSPRRRWSAVWRTGSRLPRCSAARWACRSRTPRSSRKTRTASPRPWPRSCATISSPPPSSPGACMASTSPVPPGATLPILALAAVQGLARAQPVCSATCSNRSTRISSAGC